MTEIQPPHKEGTFAAPRYTLDKQRPEYTAVRHLFSRLPWSQPKPRKDFVEYRFNAFCAIIWAVRSDQKHIFYTDLNKASYVVNKWRIPYVAMSDVVENLLTLGWIKRHGVRKLDLSFRFKAPNKSPLLTNTFGVIKLKQLDWEPPVVSVRRGRSELNRAPLDVELMANPEWKAWIAKHLIPPMEQLNLKLLDHDFVLFPYGKAKHFVQPQYQRIYTNVSGFKKTPLLLHGRLYERGFRLPGKKHGWRQMTLIDGYATMAVDVHASSLTLLANNDTLGFRLPETDDYYQYGPLASLNRELVKTVVQSLMNGVSPKLKAWPSSFLQEERIAWLIDDDLKWVDYAQPIVSLYPALAKLPKHMGMRLMLEEGDIILKAMNYLLDMGIGCLSVHDCLIVPEQHVKDAKNAFYFAYGSNVTNKPKLAAKW
jgi:hypothetical protein